MWPSRTTFYDIGAEFHAWLDLDGQDWDDYDGDPLRFETAEARCSHMREPYTPDPEDPRGTAEYGWGLGPRRIRVRLTLPNATE